MIQDLRLYPKGRPIVDKSRLIEDFKKLGIERGDSIVVRAALSKIGWVEGGAKTVLESLLEAVGHRGSLFGLSFTPIYKLPLSKNNSQKVFDRSSPTYTGAINRIMVEHPESIRSGHPNCSFVGIGPQAKAILTQHDASSPAFDPIHKLSESSNSKMLLLGTVTQGPGITTVHLAQNILGFKNHRSGKCGVNYRDDTDGSIKLYVRNDVGGCSLGFHKFYEPYRQRGAVLEGNVGFAPSMLANLKKTLAIDLEILKEDPRFFFCDNPGCIGCRLYWEFSEGHFIVVNFYRILNALKKRTLKETACLVLSKLKGSI